MLESPAEQLTGKLLDNGWTVEKLLHRSIISTGGTFSIGYRAIHASGRIGYLKAMNILAAMRGTPDPMRSLNAMTEAFIHERDICRKCTQKQLKNVVQALTDGYCHINPEDPFTHVPYLIFEMADCDIRNHVKALDQIDLAWVVRSAHNVAVGLQQLHGISVAHQDLKPSNVLVFNGSTSKVADLGRSIITTVPSALDHMLILGDKTYAPPELLYHRNPQSIEEMRFGSDLYQLGSLITFIFTQTHFNALLLDKLNPSHSWDNWGGKYEDVLPFLRDGYSRIIEMITPTIPEQARTETILAIKYLCDPDPTKRGHPDNRQGNQNPYALERFISMLDLLATKLEFNLRA